MKKYNKNTMNKLKWIIKIFLSNPQKDRKMKKRK